MEKGYVRNDDFNGHSQFGVGRYQGHAAQRKALERRAALRYPACAESSQFVVTNALVQRIEFDGRRACRVLCFRRNNQELTLRAEREIILSAGAYGSLQILMLSLGAPMRSSHSNISPIVDLPVGENLQDHPFLLLNYLTDQETLGCSSESGE